MPVPGASTTYETVHAYNLAEKHPALKILSVTRKELELKSIANSNPELSKYTEQAATIAFEIQKIARNPRNTQEWDRDWVHMDTAAVIKNESAPNVLEKTKKDTNQLHLAACGHREVALTLLGEGNIAVLRKGAAQAQKLDSKSPTAQITTGDALMLGFKGKDSELITYIVEI